MDRLNSIVEIAKHSHHMPAILSLLIGMFLLRQESYLFSDDEKVIGDNIPLTLAGKINKR